MTDDPLLPEDRARLAELLALMEPEHAQDVAEYLGIDLGAELAKRSELRAPPARCIRRTSVTGPDEAPGPARRDPPAEDLPRRIVPRSDSMRVLRDRL